MLSNDDIHIRFKLLEGFKEFIERRTVAIDHLPHGLIVGPHDRERMFGGLKQHHADCVAARIRHLRPFPAICRPFLPVIELFSVFFVFPLAHDRRKVIYYALVRLRRPDVVL